MVDTQQKDDASSVQKSLPNCRAAVETAMLDMINRLKKRGWSDAELALALADAAEDYVMELATKGRNRALS
jgi:hypothetical protein